MTDIDFALSDEAPPKLFEGGRFLAGRYRRPIADPTFPRGKGSRLRLKEWHYTSITTERHFIAVAVVQFGYVANAFAYLVDREDPSSFREFESLSPLGRALSFGRSSCNGLSVWRQRSRRIEIRSTPSGWSLDIDLPLGGRRLSGNMEVEAGDGLCLAFPLAPRRAAYTHKTAALPARGELRFGAETIRLDGGLGAIDWTRSLADHETRWQWASFSHLDERGRRVGLNLSDEVYVDARGDTPENAFWLGGEVEPLGGVRFELPGHPRTGEWRIRSREGDEVDLRFRPRGAREQHLDLKLLRSDFIQPFGVFDGVVRGETIDGAFGVVENHLSKW